MQASTVKAARPQLLTLPFYNDYKNLLHNFSGTLLQPLGPTGADSNARPIYLEEVLGALLNDASHKAGSRTGAKQEAVTSINKCAPAFSLWAPIWFSISMTRLPPKKPPYLRTSRTV